MAVAAVVAMARVATERMMMVTVEQLVAVVVRRRGMGAAMPVGAAKGAAEEERRCAGGKGTAAGVGEVVGKAEADMDMGMGMGMGVDGADTVTAWVDWRVHPRQGLPGHGRGERYSSRSWVRVARVSFDHEGSGRLAGCGTRVVLWKEEGDNQCFRVRLNGAEGGGGDGRSRKVTGGVGRIPWRGIDTSFWTCVAQPPREAGRVGSAAAQAAAAKGARSSAALVAAAGWAGVSAAAAAAAVRGVRGSAALGAAAGWVGVSAVAQAAAARGAGGSAVLEVAAARWAGVSAAARAAA